MADIRYVSIDYAEDGYWAVGNTAWYIEGDYFQDGYVIQGTTHSGEAAISAAFAITATSARTRPSDATVSSSALASATVLRVRPAAISLTSTASVTADADDINGGSVSISASSSLTSQGDRTRTVNTNLTSTASLTAQARADKVADSNLIVEALWYAKSLRIKPANSSLEAFNTQLSSTARIRSTQSDMTVSTAFSATAIKVHGARVGSPTTGLHFSGDRYITVNPTPVSAYPGTLSLPLQNAASPAFGSYVGDVDAAAAGQGLIVSIWARQSTLSTQNRNLLSSSTFETISGARSDYRFTLGGMNTVTNSVDIGFTGVDDANGPTYIPGIGIGAPFIPDTEWHHFLWHFTQFNDTVGIRQVVTTANVYIDGTRVGAYSSTAEEGTSAYITEPLFIGVRKQQIGNDPPLNLMREETLWEGDIKQIWIGFDSLGGNVVGGTYNFNIQDFYRDGLVDLGQYGRGLTENLPQPMVYEPLDYYTLPTSIGSDLTAHLFTNTASQTGTITTFDSSWLPEDASRGLDSKFTFTASGDNIKNVTADLTSEFTFNSVGYYAYFGDAVLSAQADFTATAYDFTKASATLDSQADLTLQPGNALRSAQASFQSAMSAVLVAQPTRDGDIDLDSEFTLTADATTAQLGRAVLDSEFTFAAQSYEFTKASAAFSASATLTAEGRLEERERGNLLSGMEFALSATPSRTRPGVNDLQSNLTLAIEPGNALRRGTVAMSAFAFALSAGKLVDFQDENFINPSQETGILQVFAESTLLLVEAYNGLNTVLVSDGLEQTVLAVDEETTVLLAQFNTPNN